jgi:hypothetical protein
MTHEKNSCESLRRERGYSCALGNKTSCDWCEDDNGRCSYFTVRPVEKQELTARMVIRTKALIAMKDALLPGFCEDMVCDHTCPFFISDPNDSRIRPNEPCSCIKMYHSIDRMKLALQEDQKVE